MRRSPGSMRWQKCCPAGSGGSSPAERRISGGAAAGRDGGAVSLGVGYRRRGPASNVFQGLQHFRNEGLPDLDQARMLGLLESVHQLTVRAGQVALDHVVFEVVDRLGLVRRVAVVAATTRRRGRLLIGGEGGRSRREGSKRQQG